MDRNTMTFRLAPAQMRRLENAAKQRRQSKQAFIEEFTMAAVAEYEQNNRSLGKHPSFGQQSHQHDVNAGKIEVGGLGISSLRQKPREQIDPVPPPAAPVVVQVGNTNAAPSNGVDSPTTLGDLDRLALYIIKGDEFMREARKRTALEILRVSSTTDEEFNVLVAKLEQVVSLKTKAVEKESTMNKLARFTFDKLTSLLKED